MASPARARPDRTCKGFTCAALSAKLLKEPKGAKSAEHLKHLKASDPCYNSLAPSKERTGVHELSYDPIKRYNALVKF